MEPKKTVLPFINGFLFALQFLTIIPVPKEVPWDKRHAQASIVMYPLVGLLIGAIVAVFYYGFTEWFSLSPLFIAFFLLSLGVLLSGGLHLDGWMDVSDAVGSYRDVEKKHEIMKDSRVGSFAVLSVFFLLGWRLFFMYEVFLFSPHSLYYLIVIPFLTKTMMGSNVIFAQPAKTEGLAYALQRYVHKRLFGYFICYIVLTAVGSINISTEFFYHWLILTGSAFLFLVASIGFMKRQFNGMTGDTVGATAEGGETWLWMVVWILHYFVMG
ncbi:adenosylcobinamide-GDP ribazoletransferase [Bacillus alkalicellulosilyticus]|uniref:adenosylcobinamide-GDP ribazoletransferase n=1 Tax=Alkalihalobacterium alkalicellulosilyticum TaxID=1912214 RepID=UPI00099773AF|nr:adenosylcobinamide-GDP ribazoletransferase [Bacillus alkalicellulosilyticus]